MEIDLRVVSCRCCLLFLDADAGMQRDAGSYPSLSLSQLGIGLVRWSEGRKRAANSHTACPLGRNGPLAVGQCERRACIASIPAPNLFLSPVVMVPISLLSFTRSSGKTEQPFPRAPPPVPANELTQAQRK